jgi:hypothetical protein
MQVSAWANNIWWFTLHPYLHPHSNYKHVRQFYLFWPFP